MNTKEIKIWLNPVLLNRLIQSDESRKYESDVEVTLLVPLANKFTIGDVVMTGEYSKTPGVVMSPPTKHNPSYTVKHVGLGDVSLWEKNKLRLASNSEEELLDDGQIEYLNVLQEHALTIWQQSAYGVPTPRKTYTSKDGSPQPSPLQPGGQVVWDERTGKLTVE